MAALTLDHLLVYGDLDVLVADVTAALGVEPDDGGSHPGAGTRNAIFAAAGQRAFELLGPDGPHGSSPVWAPEVRAGRGVLWWWAVRAERPLDEVRALLGREGIATTPPEPGSRVRPSGDRLEWATVDAVGHPFGTALPFVIRWGEGVPPWRLVTDPACEIRGFRLGHPAAADLRDLLGRLGLDVPVDDAEAPRLTAELVGPRGSVRFTSS